MQNKNDTRKVHFSRVYKYLMMFLPVMVVGFFLCSGVAKAAPTSISCSASPTISQGSSFTENDDLTLTTSGTCTLSNTSSLTSLTINSGVILKLADSITLTISGATSITGTLTFGSGDTVNGATNITVNSGGNINHLAYTTTVGYVPQVNINISGTLTVSTGGTINVTGVGYLGGGQGGNSSTYGRTNGNVTTNGSVGQGAAGSHGGRGGYYGTTIGTTYDSITNPTLPGAGGGTSSTSYPGLPGGGVVIITATNVAVAGTISANGAGNAQYANYYGGDGAGGTINLNVSGTFSGSGTLSAVGGNSNNGGAYDYGGGGGGRVAIAYGSITYSGSVGTNIVANGGDGYGTTANYDGSAGTVYMKATASTYGDVYIDNASRLYAYFPTDLTSSNATTFQTVYIQNYGRLYVPAAASGFAVTRLRVLANCLFETANAMTWPSMTTSTLYLTGGTAQFDNTVTFTALDTTSQSMSGTLITNGAAYVSDGAPILAASGAFTWTVGGALKKDSGTNLDSLTIKTGVTMNTPATTVFTVYTFNLTVGTLTVDSGGLINVNGRGYMGGYQPGPTVYSNGISSSVYAASTSYGLTNGNVTTNGSSGQASSGSHGGRGGYYSNTIGTTYDSITNPTLPGAGGGTSSSGYPGVAGGGVVSITATTAIVNGTISANGTTATDYANYYGGSGAGGTINLNVSGTFSGSGTLSTVGGNAGSSYAQYTGGGGGRIAIAYGSITYSGSVGTNIVANGGDGYGTAAGYDGSAGTIYLKATASTYGDVYVDNASRPYAYYSTDLTSSNATTFQTVYIQNYGRLYVPAEASGFATTRLRVLANCLYETAVASTWPSMTTSTLYLTGGTAQFDNTVTFTALDLTGESMSGTLITKGAAYVSSGAPILAATGTFTWTVGSTLQKSAGVNLDSLTVRTGVTMNTPAATTTAIYTLNLAVTTLTLDSGGLINTNGLGYMGGYQASPAVYALGIYAAGATNSSTYGRTNGNVTTNGSSGQASSGSHGGRGGYYSNTIGTTYDSITNPTLPGAGGGTSSSSYPGVAGGGVVSITATTAIVNGTISANGITATDYANYYGGSGAGGTINLNVSGTFSGSGTLSTVGGNAGSSYAQYTGGGGGRIAIAYGSITYSGSVGTNIVANGGDGQGTAAGYDGSAGTIYLKATASTYGDVYVDNASRPYAYYSTDLTSSNATTFQTVYIQNYGRLYVPAAATGFAVTRLKISANSLYETAIASTWPSMTTSTLYLNGGTAQFDNNVTFTALDMTSQSMSGALVTNGVTYVSSGTPVLATSGAFTWTISQSYAGALKKDSGNYLDSLTMRTGVTMNTPPTTTSTTYTLNLVVGTLTIDSGAAINTNGLGYLGAYQASGAVYALGISATGATNSSTYGLTNGNFTTNGSTGTAASGSHGGKGGQHSSSTVGAVYDSIMVPTLPGGGGGTGSSSYPGVSGGGVVSIIATTATINGTISANGTTLNAYANYYGGAGAGGTVYLYVSGVFSGNGTFSAVGGNSSGSYADYTGGGGGRISIIYGTNSYTGVVGTNIVANGGDGNGTTAGYDGSAGTVFMRDASSTFGNLYIYNASRPYAYYTTDLVTTIPASDQLINSGYAFASVNFGSYGVLDIPSSIDSVSDGSSNPSRKFLSNSCPTDNNTLSDGEIVYNVTAYGSATANYTCVPLTPSNPTTLYSNNTDASSGSANPTSLTSSTPVFTAVCNSSVGSCLSAAIQVSANSGFTSTVWDSGSLDIADISNGARSANITYAGSTLSFNTTYYWRIKFYGTNGAGSWSTETATFYLPRAMELYSFNLGGAVQVGQSVDILWGSVGGAADETVKIEYSKDEFVSDVNTVIASTSSEPDATAVRSYSWTIPNDVSSNVKIKISSIPGPSYSVVSESPFIIQSGVSTTGIKFSRTFKDSNFYTTDSGVSIGVIAGWYDRAWTKRKTITLTSDTAKIPATQTNFPVLVNITSDASLAANAQHSGNDILFVDSTGAKLNHEIESYTYASGALVAWVKVPTLSAGGTIDMYYGNDIATNQQNATGVWDSNYKAVWHQNESSGTVYDSTSNSISGTPNGPNQNVAGQVAGGDSFDGSNDYIQTSGTSNLDLQDLTISQWNYSTSYYRNMFMFEKTTNGSVNTQYSLFYNSDGTIYFRTQGISSADLTVSVGAANGPVASQWNLMTATYNSSTHTKKIYCNGVEIATVSSLTGTIPTNPAGTSWIGAYGGGASYPFNGSLDETRVSNIARSANWIKTEYSNQKTPSSFYTLGAETPQPAVSYDASFTNNASSIAWYNSSWGYRKIVTFTSSSSIIPSSQSNFPVLVNITSDASLAANAKSNGYDIFFTDSGGNKLSHEIESYTTSTGALVAWVKVTTLATSGQILMYYGNSGASNQQDKTGVWDSNYKGVWHLNETSGSQTDSTSNANNATTTTLTTQGSATAKIGGADDFDGTDDKVILTNNSSLQITGTAITVSAWLAWDALDDWSGMVMKTTSDSWADGYGIYGRSAGNINFYVSHWSNNYASKSYSADGQYHYVVGTYNGSNVRIFVDGVEGTSDTYTGSITNANVNLELGRAYNNDANFNGRLDEVRVSSTASSADWIKTEYNNQNSPSSFYSIGSLETYAGSLSPEVTVVPQAGHTITGAMNTFAATTSGTGTVKFQFSNDNGSTWKYCVGTTVTSATAGYAHSNTAAEINDTCLAGLASGTFNFRVYLHATDGQTATLSDFSFYIAAAPAGPDATGFSNSTDGTITDGGRVGQTIVVTGSGFGTVSAGSGRANCSGGSDTGCIKIGGTGGETIAYGDISSWSSTSITLTLTNVASYGGATDSGLVVYAAGVADTSPLTFYVYPHVTSLTVPTAVPNAAREYSADDTDGIITINGDHFGTEGTVQVSVSTATQQVTGTCAGTAYQENCIGIRIPTTAAAYSAGLTITLSSPNTKTATYDLRVLPRITAVTPTFGAVGTRMKIIGSHFCQDTSCLTSPNRSTAGSHVDFGTTQAADGDFVNSGASPCSGNSQAWMNSEICVNVPSGTPGGSQSVQITSNTYTSNAKSWGGFEASGYIISSTFDTATAHGAAPNSIMWKGTLPSTAHVKFQIASSNSESGPWSYLGSDGTEGTYYEPSAPDTPIKISSTNHYNHRYFRYKMILEPTNDTAESPTVTEVIFNWSP